MDEEKIVSSTASYYLPSDAQDWIKDQARKENRSESNYLTTLIRRLRDAGEPHAQ